MWILVLAAACREPAAAPAPRVDAGVRVDAGTPDARRKPTKAERRKKCLDDCERRNRYTDCGDGDGMTSCPCRCP